ncbi:patatin-like protein [Paracoccus lutimaris]|uniref:Patatin-related protein n=1 Tax=Paracoccus lutimaris TaxID=1490030 RepID=A0A368Z8T6_9RHOB|nr:patatin-like protein [Paracoccus lutimaris]RCW88218.1 patatin-related protein [Paracoccus lutimaris]
MVEDATGEVRFAVVLYGGVSLAIYMNGIAQELLRMVRGSSDLPDEDLTAGERIYRDLSRELAGPRGGRKRFVIDIISGTSAGGINGVALAKALVMGSADVDVLRRAWTEDADIGQLLNDRNISALGWRRTESLLDGRHMYDVLLRTIEGIQGNGTPLSEMVDLFVTATDLQGLQTPIHLTGARLDEKIHKTVFHFAYDGGRPGLGDFAPEYDGMLAFAARCTSSFPVAFPPMRFVDMPRAQQKPEYARFFRHDPDYQQRQFADGGYLDNRPFSHAIELIPFRPTTLPGERKLIFVDPFPAEKTAGSGPQAVDFLQNAKLAASTLPRTEAIRDDIRAITRINARLERLGALQARWAIDLNEIPKRGYPMDEPVKPDNLVVLDLADQVKKERYGRSYPLYHHLRVYDTTDSLNAIVARLADYTPESDQAQYLRQILRAWRDDHFSAYHKPGLQTESAFLSRYDIGFRLRRLSHLRARIDAKLDPDPEMAAPLESVLPLRDARRQVEVELAEMRRLVARRAEDAETLLTRDEIGALTARIAAEYGAAMQLTTLSQRYAKAREVYQDAAIRPLVDKALAQLGADMRTAFDQSSARIRAMLTRLNLTELEAVYDGFHWHDVTTYPFLEGTEAREHAEVQVFRISPADSALNPRPDKLAGIAVGAFGGFLNRDWREHDILWGRLDGAERIVAALMPHRPEADRRLWIDRLQDAILAEEYGPDAGRGRRLALLKSKLRDATIDDDAIENLAAGALGVTDAPALDLARFRSNYAEVKPSGPRPPEIAGWSSRSMAILSRMIGDLPNEGFLGLVNARAASGLRTGGVLVSRFTHFAMPGSYWRMLSERLLFLLLLAGIGLILLSLVVSAELARIGGVLILVSLGLWILLYALGRVLRGQAGLSQVLRWVLLAVALGLMVVGAATVANRLFG